jgi:hypothetical protein
MRKHPLLLAGALLAPLAGCGTNLLVVRRTVEFRAADGKHFTLPVDYQVADGVMADLVENPVARAGVGLLLEPIDWLTSTWIAGRAVFDGDLQVAWGPLGWLGSLTPFATLLPRLELPPGPQADATADQLARLQSADAAVRAAAAREALHDERITAAGER